MDRLLDDQLLTPAELAQILRTTVASLAQDRYHRRGCAYLKRGNRVLYRRSDLAKYLEDNTIQISNGAA